MVGWGVCGRREESRICKVVQGARQHSIYIAQSANYAILVNSIWGMRSSPRAPEKEHTRILSTSNLYN